MFLDALLRKYNIRDCSVPLDRLRTKKELLPSERNLRSEVSWLPTKSAVSKNSSDALSGLAVYQKKNGIMPAVARKNVRRQRAKSMFLCRGKDDGLSNDMNGIVHSKDDLSELHAKFKIPHFGLKPSGDRLLKPKLQSQQFDFQKIFVELKKKVESKKKNL